MPSDVAGDAEDSAGPGPSPTAGGEALKPGDEAADTEPSQRDDDARALDRPGRDERTGPLAGLIRHPLLVTAAVTGAIAVMQGVWIWTHRRLGAIDPDEAGYVATALRYQRSIDFLHPWAFVYEVGATGTGPLLPLLSLPLLIVGPRDPRAAFLAQPILMVLGALFIAGIVHRLAGPRSAIVAGVAWSVLPTVLLATQSYWLGLCAATCMAAAAYALVTSDRCDNRRIWWFGLALGCLLLSRTMTIALAPGMLLAGVVIAGRNARRLKRLAGAILIAFLVAGPWWIVEWNSIWDYLLSYGYGPRADLFGPNTPLARLELRQERIAEGIGPSTYMAAVFASGAAVLWFLARRRWRDLPAHTVEFAALAVASAAGLGALLTTSNNGVWFELPVIALLVPLAVITIASLPRPVAVLPIIPLIGMTAVHLPVAWWWMDEIPPDDGGWLASGIRGTHYENGMEQYDPRFATDRRAEQPAAAADWWDVNQRIERELRQLAGDDPEETTFTFSGNMLLVNSNTVQLAAELQGWGARVLVPDTTLSDERRARTLRPLELNGRGDVIRRCCDGAPRRNYLVLAIHDRILFTPDRDVREYARQAADLGWRVERRIALPGGGEVRILDHPDHAPA